MKITKWIWIVVLGFQIVACSKKDGGGGGPLPIVIPDPPTGPSDDLVINLVDADVNAFMSKYNIPGLSLAITRFGKLVYAKGYGYADKEALEPVKTTSLFRFASLSKWFTSACIFKLIQEGKMSFNDKVFGPGALLGTTYGTYPYVQPFITDITVEELLHHTGGGWGNSSNDPMFGNIQLNGDDLLSWILDNRPLTHLPGTVWDYSNAGFFILSHIIEKVSGKTYEQYVKDNIFKTVGITDMQFASSTLSGRKPNEVKYYGTNPYGYGDDVIARIAGAGAWIGTTTDLLRFLVTVDGFNTVPDILNSESLALMSSETAASASYACGFVLSSNGNWYHGGTYNGTRNWMVRTTTGYCWAILINTSATGNFSSDLDKLIWPAIEDATTPWPDRDLFEK